MTMMHFNELRISQDNRFLIIDASIDESSYFDTVSLDSVVIDTQDTYVSNGPSSTPIYTYKVGEKYQQVYSSPDNSQVLTSALEPVLVKSELESRRIRLSLDATDLGVQLNNTMFFVYVISTGTPSSEAPAGTTNPMIMGTVVNLYQFYQKSIYYLKGISKDCCEVPKCFIDFILRYKALELCIKTGNYTEAIKYWKKFFMDKTPLFNNSCSI